MLFNFNNLSVFFAAVKFSEKTIEKLLTFCYDNNVPNTLDPDDFHSSLICSKKMIFNFQPNENLNIVCMPFEFDIFISKPSTFKPQKTRSLVLKFCCDYMIDRFEVLIENGGQHDQEQYQPHITLSYDVGEEFNIEQLPPVSNIGELKIIKEYLHHQYKKECEICKNADMCF